MSSFEAVAFDDVSNDKIEKLRYVYTQIEKELLVLLDSREKLYSYQNLEQSFMWAVKSVEREQFERNAAFLAQATIQPPPPAVPPPQTFLVQPPAPIFTQPPAPIFTQPQHTQMSPEAAVIAEGNVKMQDLVASIKELTDLVTVNGGILPKS